ncbi:hypothetical protein DYB25_004380 [Aphanomyces astaci]|uniref:Uncharacterized protein n=1 Tax=Aphanomyces astaci TaxID=112090 RepID=A0A397E3H4_APHAT|nr:hypothetical protein DYB25_004380 [Aphanomyces astaci]RHY44682.1 hypothetical protein DYB34_005166 [Aphanomyces astaci]RHY72996.1 hypothetical protein DYB30_005803 [Aphanomyces astaci]RHY76940.1 hypothetical protein DYB38_004983 [Aphanomyces astaci]RHZ09732.1 hypothetical protein DYB31_004666 [Aphanomyces astaci]
MMQRDAVRTSLHQSKVFDEQCDVTGQLRCAALVLSVTAFFLFLYIDICPQESITVLALGTLMLAWTGPLTVLAGTYMKNNRFKVWQPFEGGFHFVSMQAVGWCLTGLLLAVCLVYLVNFHTLTRFEGQFLFIGIVGFIAQMVLNVSLDTFVADTPVPHVRPTSTTKSVVAILLSVSGCLFFVAFDWILPSSVLLVLGAVIFSVSSVVLHVGIGWCDLPTFALWQPFVGGNVFMLLQYLGWKFFACTLVSTALLSSSTSESYTGTASCMGVLGLISQLLLLTSLSFFQPIASQVEPRHTHRLPAECAVCGIVLVMTGLITLALCHDLLPPVLCPSKIRLLGLLCLLVLGAVTPLTHVGGARAIPRYQLWQPFRGDSKFVFIQSVGWTWYGIFVGVALLMHLNNTQFLVQLLPLAWLLGAASCATIVLSLLFFRMDEDSKHSATMATRGVPQLLPALFTMHLPPPERLLGHVLSTSTVVLHVVVEGCQVGGTAAALCVSLGLLLSVLAMASTHASGRFQSPSYRMWQPFLGGDAFVLRQAMAWTFFALFTLFDCLCIVACIRHDDVVRGLVLAVGVAAVVPHRVLASSVPLFQPPSSSSPLPSATPLMGLRSSRLPILANLVLVVGSLVLFAMAEWCRLHWRSFSHLFFMFGTVAAAAGLACTHCVCGPYMHSNYRLVQPFRGGLRFVVLQSAAWALGALAWVASCTTLYGGLAHFVLIDGLLVAIGTMFTVAHGLLLVALLCFDNAAAPDHPRHSKPNLVLGLILGVVACCAFALVDMVLLRSSSPASIPAFPTTACAILALVASIRPVYCLQGRVVYRVVGCTLWSATIVLGSIFTYSLYDDTTTVLPNSTSSHPLYGVLTGSLGLVTHVVLLHSTADKATVLPRVHLGGYVYPVVGVVGVVASIIVTPDGLVHAMALAVRNPMPPLVCVVCVVCFSVVVGGIARLLQPTAVVPPQPLAFPVDIVRHIATFVAPSDLAALAACSKHHQALVAPSIWHAKFASFVQSPAAKMPRTIPVVGVSSLFADSPLATVERFVLATVFPSSHRHKRAPCRPFPAPTDGLQWKHIAAVVGRGGALYQCELCLSFDLMTPSQRAWEDEHACAAHGVSTWLASPCQCRHAITLTRKMAHRACVERCRTSYICRSSHHHASPPPASSHRPLLPALRAPMTLSEFVTAVMAPRRLVAATAPSAVVVAASVLVSGSPFSGLVVWTGGMTILGAIVRSAEFDRAVQQIWNDPPAFPLYMRIINTLALSSFVQLMSSLWSDASGLLQVAFAVNSIAFILFTSVAGVVFCKANALVLTYSAPQLPMTLTSRPQRSCVLCRLHLCRTLPAQHAAT